MEKLGQLQTWARRNNAKKLALFTESLPFWTTKKIDPTVVMPEVDSYQHVAASIINTMPVPITISEEPTKSNLEEIAEVIDALGGAQSDSATTGMEFPDPTPAAVPILIPEEAPKNNAEEIDEATDVPQGAQGATTNIGAVKAKATKVAKAKPARKKGAYQTSPGSSIAKNKPKRACTLRRTIPGQPMVEASRKVSMKSSAPQKQMSDFFPKK